MKCYEITIKPVSAMGTPLKGDTLFGHFCWQAAYQPELITGGLDAALKSYAVDPFAVFSSAVPKLSGEKAQYILKRPDLPLHMLFKTEKDADRAALHRKIKQQISKKWMVVQEYAPIDLERAVFVNDDQLAARMRDHHGAETSKHADMADDTALCRWFEHPHNTINRLTGTTGNGAFAPYSVQNFYYLKGTQLAVFLLLNQKWTDIERVVTAMTTIGRFGFGRDASIGLGRFEVSGYKARPLPVYETSHGLYTLGPCVIKEKKLAARCRFTPFTRFGRHGDRLALSRNPFKAPVIMADEGAVFLPDPDDPAMHAYVGAAVTGVSKVQPQAVVQGYAPFLPIKLEQNHDG